MVDILNIKDDIVKILCYINIFFLVIAIFYSSKTVFIVAIIINIILSGTLVIIINWSNNFTAQFSKMWEKN